MKIKLSAPTHDYLALILAVLLMSGCVSTHSFSVGEPLYAVHYVSVLELLGQADWYDGQPVRVVGVAKVNSEFEDSSGIYPSTEDYRVGSYSYVFFEFPDESWERELEAKSVSGHWIVVDGIFRAVSKKRLPDPSENQDSHDNQIITMCRGICGASGYIEVRAIRDW